MRIKILIWNQNWGSTYVVTHHYMYIPILASHLFVQICMKKIYLWKHEPTAASKWDSIKLERRQLAVQYKFVVFVGGSGEQYKVHIFWEGHKILRNLHLTFDCMYSSQKQGEDFAKLCGLLRIYELYIYSKNPALLLENLSNLILKHISISYLFMV